MDFYAAINQLSTERKSAVLRSALTNTLFVLMIGPEIEKEQEAICEELGGRWSNGESRVFVNAIRFEKESRKPVKKIQAGLPVYECVLGTKSFNRLLQNLNRYMAWMVGEAAKISKNLSGSHICILTSANDSSSQWVPLVTMLCNEYIHSMGGKVSLRQLYYFLPENAYKGMDYLKDTADLCQSWIDKPAPDKKWFLIEKADKKITTAYPCNRNIQGNLFHQIVLLDRYDSQGELYDEDDKRVRLFANLMDPKSQIKWQDDRIVHSAYTYPSSIDSSFDIVMAWEILHERLEQMWQTSGRPDITPHIKTLSDMLLKCEQNVLQGMQGFALYDESRFLKLASQWGDMQKDIHKYEKEVFQQALLNKFNYLWIKQMQSEETKAAIETWTQDVRGVLRTVWEENELDAMRLDRLPTPTEKSFAGFSKEERSIDAFKKLCIETVYVAKNDEEREKQFKRFSKVFADCILERKRELKEVKIRSEELYGDIETTKDLAVRNVRQYTDTDELLSSRTGIINGLITMDHVKAYIEAIVAEDHRQAVIGLLRGVLELFSDSSQLPPYPLSNPDETRQRIACRCMGFSMISLPHGYPKILGGKGTGLYYLTSAVDIDRVQLFKEAKDKLG